MSVEIATGNSAVAAVARARYVLGSMGHRRRMVAAALCALGLPVVLAASEPAGEYRHPGLVFLLATVAATFVGGPWAGAAATGVSMLLLQLVGGGDDALGTALFGLFGLLVIGVDRRRRHAEAQVVAEVEAARRSEYRYRALVDRLPVGIYIDEVDVTATNIYSNPRIVEMFGYPAESWMGDPDFFARVVHPDDREAVLREIADTIESDAVIRSEYRIVGADGRVHWVIDEGVRVLAEDGSPLHVQGVLIDVTERKEAERRVEELQARYQSLVENLPLVSYVEDAAELGRTLYISPQVETLVGYGTERWLDERDFFFEVLHPDDHERIRSARGASARSSQEFRLRTRDGDERWIHSERVTVTDAAGAPLYVQGFWVDVTESRELQQQLRQLDRMDALGRFSAGVAHDFNNLLLAIRGHAELLGLESSLDEHGREDIQSIVAASDRAAALTAQLLAFARQDEAEKRAVGVDAAVAESAALLQRLLPRTISLRTELSGERPSVLVAEGAIQQIVMNLVINARDAIGASGAIVVRTEAFAGADGAARVRLSVTDDGCGMDCETQRRVFEPFFTTKPVGSGTGLGLATVYGIVHEAAGEITIDSEPGAGTTIAMELPCVSPNGAEAALADRALHVSLL